MTLAAALAATALRPNAPAAAQPRTPAGLVEHVRLRSDGGGGRWRGDVLLSFANVASRPLRRVTLRLWDDGIRGCTHPLPVRVRVLAGGRAGRLAVDCSALPVELARPLPRGRRAQLRLSLAIDVPDRDDRFGRIGGVVFVGNALPLPALTDASGPHLDPYVRDGESFYSLAGDFTLELDTPRSMAVAATGLLRATRPDGAGRLRRTFVATRVRDAAWVAGAFHSVSARVPGGPRVRVLYPSAFDRTLAGEALRLAERAMGRYAAWFGPYPYPEVDVVLAPFGRFSGMEYPTLVLSVPAAVPIAHELAHQWWYGIVGDDEYRAPWLDESFATWSERAFDGTAGAGCASLGWPPAPAARVTATMAYWRTRPRDYGTVVYGQGACALQALSARLGRRRFLTLLREYVARHRFGISTTASFEAAAQTASPDASLAGLWHRYRIG